MEYALTLNTKLDNILIPRAEAVSIRVGLFKNQHLIAWARPISADEQTSYYDFTLDTDPQIQRAVSTAQQLSGTTTVGGVNEAASSAAAEDAGADSEVSTESESAAESEAVSESEAASFEASSEAAESAASSNG